MFTKEELTRAGKFSSNHRAQLEKDKVCGCFFCGRIFSPKEIEDWMHGPGDELGTACCPYCWIDSVIGESSGFPITEEFLDELHEFEFGGHHDEDDEEDAGASEKLAAKSDFEKFLEEFLNEEAP